MCFHQKKAREVAYNPRLTYLGY